MSPTRAPRPDPEECHMSSAVDQAARSNCRTTTVGAVLVRDERIIATGYNGTVHGYRNCFADGCPRCKARAQGQISPGAALGSCICVHAEQNALLMAARFGIRVEGTECWVTTEPCLDCTKQLIQSKVSKVVYWNPYVYKREEEQLGILRSKLRKHAEASVQPTLFARWTPPPPDVLDLKGRYSAITERQKEWAARNGRQ
jgi:dCMP deaminase